MNRHVIFYAYDVRDLRERYPNYNFIVTAKKNDGSFITPLDAVSIYIYTRDIYTKSEVDELVQSTAEILKSEYSKTIDYSSNFEVGGINATTGNNSGSDTLMRTKSTIDENAIEISTTNDFLLSLYAYESNSYRGYYSTSNVFTTTGTLLWNNTINVSKIRKLYPTYKFKIVIKRVDGGAIFETNVFERTMADSETHNTESYIAEKDAFVYRKIIPSYYFDIPETATSFNDNEYLQSKINSIPNGKHFIFITDPHWNNNNQKNSTAILQYVKAKTGIKDVFMGGDILNQENTKYLAKMRLEQYMNEMKEAFGSNFLTVQGNHDKNVANLSAAGLDEAVAALPYDEIYKSTMSHFADRVHFADWSQWLSETGATGSDLEQLKAYSKMHYYMDDEEQKIRYIVVCATNTDNNGVVRQYMGAKSLMENCLQYDWFRDVLVGTPENYDIVVISHVIFNDKRAEDKTWESTDIFHDAILYYALMMSGLSLNKAVTVRNPSSDATLNKFFATGAHTMRFDGAANHNAIFMIGGDCHSDEIASIKWSDDLKTYSKQWINNGDTVSKSNIGEIPCFTTITDARAVQSKNSKGELIDMSAGTVHEQAFDVVTITSDKKIVLTRFGAGEDRMVRIN